MIINQEGFPPSVKGIILDIDGVLVRGREVIPGSVEAVRKLSEVGIRICYLTNNPTKSRRDIATFLKELGFASSGNVITSGMATSRYILNEMGPSRCLVIGEKGLEEELKNLGHYVISPVDKSIDERGPTAECVVCSLDREFNYSKLTNGLRALRDGARFIATNEDPTLPCEDGNVLPGGGSIVAALKTASGMEPFVVGKPNPYSTLMAVNLMDLDPTEVLMVGDRYDTDIAAGRAAGTDVALVLSGDIKECPEVGLSCYPDLPRLVEDHSSRSG